MDVLPGLVVLRLTDRVVLDHPFPVGVPLPLWAATLDPDSSDPSGWRRSMWPTVSGGRGWSPDVLHFGDVVEFGSYSDQRWRWFGWYTHHAGEAIVVTGPFSSPGEAWVDGEPARREIIDRALHDYQQSRLHVAVGESSATPHPAR